MTANEIPIGIWISFALTVVALALSQMLFSRLEKHHRITFEQMGSPHLFANNTPHNNMLFQRWLFSAKSLQLDDTVSSMVWALRALEGILLASYVWNALLMFKA